MTTLKPRNLTAQLNHRARGNPPNTLPVSAISNCFPGLEFDFRAIWRRILVGLVLSENNNFVVAAEDPALERLVGHRLLKIDGFVTSVGTSGVVIPGNPPQDLGTLANPNGVSFMEWSNSLARVLAKQGQTVPCTFTRETSYTEVLPDSVDAQDTVQADLTIRHVFERVEENGVVLDVPVLARELVQPGELSQGLCSPWQNDYRECACYYWAASRPDYVNVVDTAAGVTAGDNWLAKERTGRYIPDNRTDSRLVSYDDLFRNWQGVLRFVVDGQDAVGVDALGNPIPPPRPDGKAR